MNLHPGDHRITIAASTTRANGTTSVVGWDIALWTEGAPAPIVVTKGAFGTSTDVPVRIDREQRLEARTFYSGQDALRVDSLTIRREH